MNVTIQEQSKLKRVTLLGNVVVENGVEIDRLEIGSGRLSSVDYSAASYLSIKNFVYTGVNTAYIRGYVLI